MRITALALLAALLAGCDGAIRDPVGLGAGPDDGLSSGGGGGGGGGRNAVLVGTWQASLVYQLSSDVQRHTITWTFGAAGTCDRTMEIYSVLEDRTYTSRMPCSWQSTGSEVAITWAGAVGPVRFRWSVQNFSPSRLVLDGVPYARIG